LMIISNLLIQGKISKKTHQKAKTKKLWLSVAYITLYNSTVDITDNTRYVCKFNSEKHCSKESNSAKRRHALFVCGSGSPGEDLDTAGLHSGSNSFKTNNRQHKS
jgi:hypothetical protein